MRMGVHTGEIEVSDRTTDGPAVTFAKMIAEQADPREVLASLTVKDLVAGADLCFNPRSAVIPTFASNQIQLFNVDR